MSKIFWDGFKACWRRIFSPPRFQDEEKNRISRTVYLILWTVLVGASVYAFVMFLEGQPRVVIVMTIGAIGSMVSLFLVRWGRTRMALFLILFIMLGMVTYLNIIGRGIHDIGILLYPLIMVVSTTLFRRWEFLAITGLTILSIGVVVAAESFGMVNGPFIEYSPFINFFSVALILGVVAVSVRLLSRDLLKSMLQARESANALAEREERYRLLIETSPDGIALIDLQGVVISCNQKAAEIFGFSSVAELTNRNAFEFIVFEEHDKVRQHLATAIQKGQAQQVAYWFVRADRSRFLGELSSNLILDANQNPLHFVTIIRDVSVRHAAETALLESEYKYRQLVDNSLIGIYITQKHVMKFCNQRLAEMFGFQTPVEVINRSIQQLVAPESWQVVDREVTLRESGKKDVSHYEFTCLRRDGQRFQVEVLGATINYEGQPAVQGVMIDVSARKVAETSLRESEARYRAIVDSFDGLIYICSSDYRVEFMNRQLIQRTGYDGTGQLCYKVLHDLDAVCSWCVNDRVFLGETVRWEVQSPKDNHWFYVVNTPIHHQNGSYSKQAMILDITDRKKAEEERRRLEVEIRQNQKLESLGTLAGGIAHDFNNIISIIIGHVDALLKSLKDRPKVRKTLQTISEAAERGASMVKQILTFARKSEVEFQTVDISQVIAGLVRMLSVTFPRTIEIEFKSQPELPQVYMDPAQLHQALLNLCINARDAMAGKGKLTISAALVDGSEIVARFPDADGQRLIHIQVADTGVGLDEQTRSRIFEPFFTTKGRGKGTGLGLAVVYGVVQTHRGFIEVESQPGRGTTFSLFFPISAHRAVAVAPVVDKNEIPTGHEMILVVEDEESLRELLTTALEDHGYDVITARDGSEALERYRHLREQIGLVITDMDLPKINGAAVSQSILGDDPGARIIMISGFIEPSLKSAILACGVREFVAKPYSLAQMLRTIRRVLDSDQRPG